MALFFETVQTPGIAQVSYVIGDTAPGVCAVIDPRTDVDIYMDIARRANLQITHIFETHIHADFVSGSRSLAALVPTADIYVGEENAAYGFPHRAVHDRDRFTFGGVILEARHTPGHTPEHMSYVLFSKSDPDSPWGVLTGDSLFVQSAGRPDLMGSAQTPRLVEQLYDTIHGFYATLPDHVIIYPGHAKGSPCGADIGDRLTSTIGYERTTNVFLKIKDRAAFKEYALSSAPPVPHYYPRMKKLNAAGPEAMTQLPTVAPLALEKFKQALNNTDNVLVDTRHMLAFGGGHIAGAVNLGHQPEMSIWAGWMLDPQRPILLVVDRPQDIDSVVRLLVRSGYAKFAGYLAGGMTAWANGGEPLQKLGETPVHELNNKDRAGRIIDVRTPDEWKGGHIPGAQHMFLPQLMSSIHQLNRSTAIFTYCATGYRGSIAASVLQQQGFTAVHNVPGSWQAWRAAGLPVEK